MKYRLNPIWLLVSTALGALSWLLTRDVSFGIAVFAIFLMPAIVHLYIRYAKDNPKHLWFKRKLYGWGWTPVTWQGWLITGLYVGVIAALTLTIDETSSAREVAFMIVLPFVILTALFFRIAYKKGERPRWQWGEDERR